MDDDMYHYDFTTASDLEIFIARLEEVIQDWGLHKRAIKQSLLKNDFINMEWDSISESIKFSDAEFMINRYYLKCSEEENSECDTDNADDVNAMTIMDMMNMENDFFPISNPPNKDSHPLARWYGLRDFLVVVPQYSYSVASESRIKILLSAISIACNNVQCQVPVFMQALEPWQCYFLGIFQSGNFRTDFNMVHLKRTPLHCKFLTGLLTLFKAKVGLGMLLNPVTVSVQLTYVLKDWSHSSLSQELSDADFSGGDILNMTELGCLPFGSPYDSTTQMVLNAIWPILLENSFVDGENYSDLEPFQAPIWKVSVTTVENPSCILSDYFTEFLLLTGVRYSIKELLGNIISGNTSSDYGSENDITSSLNALTESKISAFSKAVIGAEKLTKKESAAKQLNQSEKPISSDHLMILLYYLFPDADENCKTPYSENLGGKPPSPSESQRESENFDKTLSGMKSAPVDGLLWRLSIIMAHVIHSLGGVKAAAYFWYEFTQELRYRWENGITIQGVEFAFPDSKTCLLNQKLQLLNCCISKKIQRDKEARKNSEENSESEEEFYDCDADLDDDSEFRGRKTRVTSPDKPMGRQAKHGNLKLLETGEPLYIPVTQDSVPKTEDQLEEDTQVLLKLGANALGSELRARLLSAYLLSDMEAFKAANPGCVLADFIRWCSPRDWIEDEDGQLDEYGQKKGHLSGRMEIPDNTWLKVWQVARPSPAKWQKRLFNETKEAEKVLDYLERKTPAEFIELLLPVFTVCVIQKILEENTGDFSTVNETLTKLIKKAERLGRMPKIDGNSYKELTIYITTIETFLIHYKCLTRKFSASEKEPTQEMLNFLKNLVEKGETEVPGGPKSEIGAKIKWHFSEAAKVDPVLFDSGNQLTSDRFNVMSPFPSPHEKEMILRLSTPKGPQRLHAVLKKNECRLCGAFTKNLLLPNQ